MFEHLHLDFKKSSIVNIILSLNKFPIHSFILERVCGGS